MNMYTVPEFRGGGIAAEILQSCWTRCADERPSRFAACDSESEIDLQRAGFNTVRDRNASGVAE